MNKIVLGALAVCTAGSLGFAGSTDGEYLSLDRELTNLATSLQSTGPSGVKVSAFLRTSLTMADQDMVNKAADDLTGFSVDNARLAFDADAGQGYGLHISADAGAGAAALVDAYATFQVGDYAKGTMGRFRGPFLWQGAVDENHLLFNDFVTHGYSLNGALAAGRDNGVMVSGGMQQFTWGVAVQNGSDGLADKHRLTGRATFAMMGSAAQMQEGAYGAGEGQNLVLGVGYTNDDGVDDGSALGFDLVFNQGPLYAHAQVADYDKGVTGTIALPTAGKKPNPYGPADTTPWDVTVSYLIAPDWEIAGRYEDFDDLGDTTHMGAAVIYYANGHNAKWGLEFDNYDGDGQLDGTSIGLSLTVGA